MNYPQLDATISAELDKLSRYSFEVGPIRPPSEAYSLLLRVTRNCPWNRCDFCPAYKGQKFQLREVEEIKQDINTVKAISEVIEELAWKMGYGGRTRDVAGAVIQTIHYNSSVQNVALWLYFGAETAFLQDANTLIVRTPELIEVIKHLKQTLPSITRITSYARSKTAAKKSLEELRELHEVGLSRLHTGLESGSDMVLQSIQKGVTAADHINGGRKVVESGISLSEYVMPGLGGKVMSQEHALETARVLNQIDPDFIRLRSLAARNGTPLWEKVQRGEFIPLTEDEMVEEIRMFIEALECHSEVKSDHILNLIPEVEGNLPDDKANMLGVIDYYLALSPEERLNFQLGRRTGHYQSLEDMKDVGKYTRVEQMRKRVESSGNDIEIVTARIRQDFI